MYVTHEKVAVEFLLDDLNDLVHSHADLIATYEDAQKQVKAPELKRLLEQLREDQAINVQLLAQLVSEHGGKLNDTTDIGQIAPRMRVVFGSLLSDGAVVRALHTAEAKLVQEYTRAINNLTYIPGLESVLESNRLSTQRRQGRLQIAINLDE
ncbi:DUF2383 domain-containing protein [Gilvimarinus xylanilyticus]|uniref:PA2169 family four-helix-bundle protein n=1 Tax=Gilvimarinus xylanilyticus TaxID=2944139 RepID=A0A9X2I2C6_9GAMM|nr:DUF2383 domain-containing protein [Gilvimarinus xylanilyticus]MCP8898207.1 PA2169 family four-helix-bundle protein [Gilvimarinus xylanilyticus]